MHYAKFQRFYLIPSGPTSFLGEGGGATPSGGPLDKKSSGAKRALNKRLIHHVGFLYL